MDKQEFFEDEKAAGKTVLDEIHTEENVRTRVSIPTSTQPDHQHLKLPSTPFAIPSTTTSKAAE